MPGNLQRFNQKLHLDERHEARRVLVQALYAQTFLPDRALSDFVAEMLEEFPPYAFDEELLQSIAAELPKHQQAIDQKLTVAAPERPLDQIARVDLVILRIACLELLFLKNAPVKVIINEAVELAKEFGGEVSYKFVNGTLGTISKDLETLKLKT